MAQALAESGSRVAILDLDGTEAAKAAQRLTEHLRATAQDDADVPLIVSHTVDVGNVESVEAAFLAVRGELGVVNTLVTSAGFCENFGAEDYPAERIRRLFDVNFFGTYFCASALARNLIEQKERGSIVFIGSMSGSVVNIPQKQAPYNASKAAVRHLAASMAVEWAPHGIRVNCISPGYMLTDLTKRILKEKPELGLSWTEKTPAGRMGKPADLMGAVVYLASDASDYVTGAELKVDGGYTAI